MSYKILAPQKTGIETFLSKPILSPFEDIIMDFICDISDTILRDPTFRGFPELNAMAFWMRKKNIFTLKARFESDLLKPDTALIGRGIAFHIAPSNVDTIFIYSWFISMLVGNSNIIRISGKASLQREMLIGVINKTASAEKYSKIRDRFMIVSYGHDAETTADFSSLCDMRVIWGGDETVKMIRSIPLNPSASEIVFADKFSLSVINAEKFILFDKKEMLIERFYNDTYWFQQMACSSPRVVFWVGEKENADRARHIFWEMLEAKIAEKKPEFSYDIAFRKLLSEYSLAASSRQGIIIDQTKTNLINRVFLASGEDIQRETHCGGGLFYELSVHGLNVISQFITKKDQTMTTFGFSQEELRSFIRENKPKGINRIVPIGDALTFSVIWDSYNLLRQFSKEIEIRI